jgi:hypothetical protein
VFAEFSDAASVDAFLKADLAPTWKGQPLQIMSKLVLFLKLDYVFADDTLDSTTAKERSRRKV